MTPRSLTLMLLLCAAVSGACGYESGFQPEPEPPPEPDSRPVFTQLDLSPDYAELFPGDTLHLNVGALDQSGAPMQGTGAANYSSSAPEIVEVSSGGVVGVVTAAAPGIAMITATLTLGGTTQTASMTVRVHGRGYPRINGVYDLTALITSYDPAWGEDLEGYRYTAVLTLQEGFGGPPWFGGTYADLRLVGPGGDSYYVAEGGPVAGTIQPDGRLVIELIGDGNSIGLSLIVTTSTWGFIDGTFGCCGHISGTFTAEARWEW